MKHLGLARNISLPVIPLPMVTPRHDGIGSHDLSRGPDSSPSRAEDGRGTRKRHGHGARRRRRCRMTRCGVAASQARSHRSGPTYIQVLHTGGSCTRWVHSCCGTWTRYSLVLPATHQFSIELYNKQQILIFTDQNCFFLYLNLFNPYTALWAWLPYLSLEVW